MIKTLFKLCFLLFSASFFSCKVFAATFYFSSSKGKDTYSIEDAKSRNTPWQSLRRLNAFMHNLKAGDSVLFKRGDVFYGQLVISGSDINSIVFDAYGTGANPVVSGLLNLTNWTAVKNSVIQTTCQACKNDINILLLNGMQQPPGRYPNAGAANGGYLSFENFDGNKSITDNQLNKPVNWAGGQIVIRKNRWVLDRNLITQQDGQTISYQSQSGYAPAANGYGYFIQNHIEALDKSGEWCFDNSSKKISIYLNNQTSKDIEISTVDTLVYIKDASNIVFKNLQFKGANNNCIELNKSQHISFHYCQIFFSGKNAFNTVNTNYLTVKNTSISYTNNNALNIDCNYSTFQNDTIKNTGIFPGLGDGDSGSYEAILLNGHNNYFTKILIDSTGYIPVTFNGDSITISNSVINHFTLVKDDGGGIYTWNNSSNPTEHYGNIIKENIILNGIAAPYGTDNKSYLPSNGIYVDDNAGNILITGNTVADCAQHGIFIHNAHNNSITANTIFNNADQLAMIHDNIAADKPVIQNIATQNIFFSKTPDEPVAVFKTVNNDIAAFGNFNSNFYCRPFNPALTINTSFNNGKNTSRLLTLDGWKSIYKKDILSKPAPVVFASYSINSFTENNKFKNGNFDNNIEGLYCYSNQNNCVTTWSNKSVMDGGALQLVFNPVNATNNFGSVIIGIGSVKANGNYILKFNTSGFDKYTTPQVYLRQSQAPYKDLSSRIFFSGTIRRSGNELLLTAQNAAADASIVFDVNDQSNPIYFDNIKLAEANITKENPDDNILFIYNTNQKAKQFLLNNNFVDVTGKVYQNSITLQPFTSVVLMKQQQQTFTSNNH